jgi:hypothetical protein
MIGDKSGKCISYGVKSTDCRKCLFTDDPTDHDCRKNFSGSVKSMESAIAVDLVSNLMDMGCRVNYITMDEDSTTIRRINTLVDPGLQKKSDKNHIEKTISNSLFDVKKDYQVLSTTVISYLVKCVSYTIAQNKDDPDTLQNNLLAIVPHAFGNHEQRNESWCVYLRKPDEYKHNGLPKRSDRLIHIGSSQANESLNQIISTKVPKAKHFGGSESLNFRVAAGVAQKNVGRKYIVDVSLRADQI